MYIRPFGQIVWNPEISYQTLVVEDSNGNLYRYTTAQSGIHITDVGDKNWVKINGYEDWVAYLWNTKGSCHGTLLEQTWVLNGRINEHFNPTAPERTQQDIIIEKLETMLEEALEAREPHPMPGTYGAGYDDGRVAGLRSAITAARESI